MQTYWSLEETSLPASYLTIGSFDGVHQGHQIIIQKLVKTAHASGVPAAVLTFFPHPSIVLRGHQEPIYLTSPEERATLLGNLGVDVVVTQPFTHALAGTPAQSFMELVIQSLHPQHIMVGYDFALGRNREGNVDRLRQLGEGLGYTLDVIQPVQMDAEIVSSSQIRTALAEGDLAKANRLLGRPYQVNGAVIHGDGRGKSLGIPTANLDVWPWRALPRAGVYACLAHMDGQTLRAVTNVGVRPTFEERPVPARVETHILDFNQDVYGKELLLDFIERLRDEQRFPNIDALVAQIQQDIQNTREILGMRFPTND